MSRSSPKLRCFARNIIHHEAEVNPTSPTRRATVLPVLERLRPLLVIYMGIAGYKALIFRALVLAREEVPWLCDVNITADAGLTDHSEFSERQNHEMAGGGEALLAHLIGLLVAFIGEVMMLRLVHEVWPDLPNEDDFTQENEHEQTNRL